MVDWDCPHYGSPCWSSGTLSPLGSLEPWDCVQLTLEWLDSLGVGKEHVLEVLDLAFASSHLVCCHSLRAPLGVCLLVAPDEHYLSGDERVYRWSELSEEVAHGLDARNPAEAQAKCLEQVLCNDSTSLLRVGYNQRANNLPHGVPGLDGVLEHAILSEQLLLDVAHEVLESVPVVWQANSDEVPDSKSKGFHRVPTRDWDSEYAGLRAILLWHVGVRPLLQRKTCEGDEDESTNDGERNHANWSAEDESKDALSLGSSKLPLEALDAFLGRAQVLRDGGLCLVNLLHLLLKAALNLVQVQRKCVPELLVVQLPLDVLVYLANGVDDATLSELSTTIGPVRGWRWNVGSALGMHMPADWANAHSILGWGHVELRVVCRRWRQLWLLDLGHVLADPLHLCGLGAQVVLGWLFLPPWLLPLKLWLLGIYCPWFLVRSLFGLLGLWLCDWLCLRLLHQLGLLTLYP